MGMTRECNGLEVVFSRLMRRLRLVLYYKQLITRLQDATRLGYLAGACLPCRMASNRSVAHAHVADASASAILGIVLLVPAACLGRQSTACLMLKKTAGKTLSGGAGAAPRHPRHARSAVRTCVTFFFRACSCCLRSVMRKELLEGQRKAPSALGAATTPHICSAAQ